MSEAVTTGIISDRFQPVVPIIDETEAREIQTLLEKSPPWLSIAAHLKPAFGLWRNRDLARYVRVGSLPIWAINLILSINGYSQYRDQFEGGDAILWVRGVWGIGLALTASVLLAQLSAVQRHFVWLAAPGGAFVVAKYIAAQQLLVTPAVVADERFYCMMTVFIITMALRLTLLQAVCTLLAGGGLGMLFVVAYDPSALDWDGAGHYYLVSCLFSLFMAWQLEEKEKVGFLQSVLIARGARNQEQLNLELSRLAHQDGLSGLPNRREFDRRLKTEWERMRREQRALSLLFIDIDNFKAYNDHYGHSAGDECLTRIGRTIGGALLRPGDVASRYGGEEFVVILPDTDAAGALDVAQRVLAAVDTLAIPHATSETAAHATVSIGVATAMPTADTGFEGLLLAADKAMYAAKHAGRHTIRSA